MRYKIPSSCNPLLLVGLIAHFTGLTLQDDIATTARRLQQLGRDILESFTPSPQEASRMHKRPISLAKLRHVPQQFSWVDQRLVRERYIDQLSPSGLCPLSLSGHRGRCPGPQLLRRPVPVPALVHDRHRAPPGPPGADHAGLGRLSTPALPGLSPGRSPPRGHPERHARGG